MRVAILLPVLHLTILASAQPLPTGASPPALAFPHFPSRQHAFIWRNWNLVDTVHLANVLETTPQNVRALAASLGLPAEPPPPAYRARLYLTIIRRNWHLLPYDQLLELLEMTSEQLAYTLREDDFLWIKLGGLKPTCDRLVYVAPTEVTKRREAEIKRIVTDAFAALRS